jgi:predicted RNase H-like HicB family nuclease
MTEYAVVIEKAGKNSSEYVPYLPGCVSTGAALEKSTADIREAIAPH